MSGVRRNLFSAEAVSQSSGGIRGITTRLQKLAFSSQKRRVENDYSEQQTPMQTPMQNTTENLSREDHVQSTPCRPLKNRMWKSVGQSQSVVSQRVVYKTTFRKHMVPSPLSSVTSGRGRIPRELILKSLPAFGLTNYSRTEYLKEFAEYKKMIETKGITPNSRSLRYNKNIADFNYNSPETEQENPAYRFMETQFDKGRKELFPKKNIGDEGYNSSFGSQLSPD